MKVLEKGDGWFLLDHEGERYLDVSCDSGFTSFSLFIKVNKAEESLYGMNDDISYMNLAHEIQRSPDTYKSRNIQGNLENLSYQAIVKFNSEST